MASLPICSQGRRVTRKKGTKRLGYASRLRRRPQPWLASVSQEHELRIILAFQVGSSRVTRSPRLRHTRCLPSNTANSLRPRLERCCAFLTLIRAQD